MPGGLLTDLYELNMAASYLRRGMTGLATFSLYVRELPPERGFLVAAGLDDCLAFLESFSFDDEDLEYLGGELGYDPPTVEAFGGLRFTGEVWALPEGTIVFADEPILEVTAPIAEAQLVETYLLNRVTLHTTLTSKAARCRLAAQDRGLVDFSFRRTQGVDAAMVMARAAAIAGFEATSNVEAARRFGLRAAGTMAHSYIEAFEHEAAAFRAFAEDFPNGTTFLVDTYDTLDGTRAAIGVIQELGLRENLAVRLDSGDLSALARGVRGLLDESGLTHVRIIASGGLDEYAIDDLIRSGAPIDSFGVGTRVGVSADAPHLDSAYKLVEYEGRPVFKRSPGKETRPGAKQVFRGAGMEDGIGLRVESAPEARKPLLRRMMHGGTRTEPAGALGDYRTRLAAELDDLPESARRIREPVAPTPALSSSLRDLTQRLAPT